MTKAMQILESALRGADSDEDPGDDHQTAVEFLEWLREQGVRLVNVGYGHNDGDSPVGDMQRIALAVSFAERPNA